MKLTHKQQEWLQRMQEEWLSIMEPFSLEVGWSEQFIKRGMAFTPIPKLRREHLANTKLLPSREELLEELPRGGICGEVGTQHGYFAKMIYEIVQPRELHLFDLSFDKFEAASLLTEAACIVKHTGPSAQTLARIPDGFFDWLYIDADHSYESVSRDIKEATRAVKQSGFLVFNDFTYWSPLEAMPYGVAHAVCELCLDSNWEITYFALEPWMYCDVVLRRK